MRMQAKRYACGTWRSACMLVVLSTLNGLAPATAARAHGTAAAARRVLISAFRVSTVAAVDRWVAQTGFYPLAAQAATFPAGTTQIGCIFLFTGAVPHVTTEQVVARGPHGLRVASGKPRVLRRASDGIYEYLSAPMPLAYPNGRYSAVVLIDGRQAAQTSFTVG